MKKAQMMDGGMIGITIFVIIAIVGLAMISDSVTKTTTTTTVTDDQFTAANATCVRVTNDCYLTGTGVLENASNGLISTGNFTECGAGSNLYGYVLKSNQSTASLNGATINATYTGIDCTYLSSNGIARLIIPYATILFSVLILLGVWAFVKSKE